MDSNKVWYVAHLAASIALAVLSAVSVALLATNTNLPPVNSFGGVIIFVFVVPGTLLVFAINQLLLWRRRPRVIRTSDKVVMIIVAALIVAAMLSTIDEEFGFGAVFFVVPLIMLAGVVSTIVIAVGNMRAAAPVAPVAPVEPGAAPVAQTLDELFPVAAGDGAVEASAASLGSPITEPGAPPVPLGEPGTPEAPGATPYGPKA